MDIASLENICMLLATVIGLLICLFRYIDISKRGWMIASVYFLARLLSDYYWTTYTLIMHEDPDVSGIIAYLGWNIAYLVLLFLALNMRQEKSKRYIHPLMFLPIIVDGVQFAIYIQYGGIFNNLWQCGITTAVSVVCIQSILFYIKHRREEGVHIPYTHIILLLLIVTEYGMWTASCFSWPSDALDPYYYFAFSNYAISLFMAWAIGRDYHAEGLVNHEKSADETRSQILLQVIVSFIILGGCAGGYYLGTWMKKTLPADSQQTYSIIAISLFVISVFFVLLILGVIYVIAQRYRNRIEDQRSVVTARRNKINFITTLIVTLALMTFMVVFNSRIYYGTSVTGLYDSGEDKAASIATELETYLSVSESTLRVTADTVEMMISNGETQEAISAYLTKQTENQAEHFDENFTGLYGYIRGEYMDGSGWIPPNDYNVEERDWYKQAVDADGQTIIVSPYVDAQTHSVVITICKLIDHGGAEGSYSKRDVVALDVIVGHVQDITEAVDISGKGYAMIVNRDGMIVAHREREKTGEDFRELYDPETLKMLNEVGNGTLNADMNAEPCTLFVCPVLDQWYVVIVISDSELLEDVRSQLLFNIVVSLVIFGLISFFYYLGYKNEQVYGKKMEEMSVSRQKQEYEAEMLRLEKLAADEANKAKSSFLADMSHEIRTPINAILGMNEMILREAGSDGIVEYARNIKVSGRNLLQLINSILDFSKIEDGKMDIVPVRYSVKSMITYLVNSIQERANAKGLDFILDIDPELPSELFGDDARISQVILNLLTNAVKYTPEGSVTMIMEGREKTADSIKLYVEVKDTGIGIKEEDMEKLFESFERLDVTRNRNIEGTGLGMSIITKLLSLMDSEIKVNSVYGEGSVFYFELLQKIEDPVPIGEYRLLSPEDEEELYSESFHAPDARIMIVDDTKMNVTVACSLLKKTQIQIDTAYNGVEAVRLAERQEYDVILMDQRMPGMDGTQALEAIRALDNHMNAETPVICLTADAIRGAKEKYMAEGFSDYLTKPVEGPALEKMLITYLPADKVILDPADPRWKSRSGGSSESTRRSVTGTNAAGESIYAALRDAGIDTTQGLNYCLDDEEVYFSVLSEYAQEETERRESIEWYYRDRDWDNYGIFVHSLKSTSKMLGATGLFETAAVLEEAAKNKDTATIDLNHEKALRMYASTAEAIRDALSEAGYEEADDDPEEVFEFPPE
ncbi:MAG: response regulator [Lachnospiraceae bacterium]|nr:response regulator [Lachnospiraceae bacterium]